MKEINLEVMDRTDKKTLYNALNNDDFWIIQSDNVWWIEKHSFMTIGDRLYKTLKNEMKRLYPQLVYINDLDWKNRQKGDHYDKQRTRDY